MPSTATVKLQHLASMLSALSGQLSRAGSLHLSSSALEVDHQRKTRTDPAREDSSRDAEAQAREAVAVSSRQTRSTLDVLMRQDKAYTWIVK